MLRLLKSSKFWTAIIDVTLSTVLYFVGRYAAPEAAEDVKYLIAAVQPVFIMVIVGIFAEDVATKRAGR